jgi:glycerol-3-phosphate dehydrogenase
MAASTKSSPIEVDCLVLGGGITGAGVARDAGMRGLHTLLVDSDDFASGTSHLTSKLIHGGLRYLDQGKIRLAAEGVMERDRLLNRLAPTLVRPMKFILPDEGRKFPKWLFTVVGIQTYGFIEMYRSGRGCLPMLGGRLRRDYPGLLQHPFGVSYWDAQTNDARLVMAVLRTANAHGVATMNHTAMHSARLQGDTWSVRLVRDGVELDVRARSIVNATGPWSPKTAGQLGFDSPELVWLKGSHLLVTRKPNFGDDAIIVRSIRDDRPLWVIPWETRLIVGSTEKRFEGDLREVHPDADEVDDLWSSLLRFFPGCHFTREDIKGAFAGVRPIVAQDEESENRLSRRHEIKLDRDRRLVTIHGGKLTTFRKMAEEAVDQLGEMLGAASPGSELRGKLRKAILWPDIDRAQAKALSGEFAAQIGAAELPGAVVDHVVRIYGANAREILAEGRLRPDGLMPLFEGLPYTLAELAYLIRAEHVLHLPDLAKRRTSTYFLADRAGLDRWPSILDALAADLKWSPRRSAHHAAKSHQVLAT